MRPIKDTNSEGKTLDIIAFKLHDLDFCLETKSIREIRGRGKSTPVPHAPREVLGVLDLRGAVIPIIDLAHKLGMKSTVANERSAIVVAEVHSMVIGLVESLSGFYLPEGFKDIAAYVVVLVMLVVRPNGLFGEKLRKKV